MKIATFNVNNVNRRLPNLLAWLAQSRPDIVALQELKAEPGSFPAAALEAAGYGAVWEGEARWNGVAILARGAMPEPTRRRLPGAPSDGQARYIEAAVRGVLVASIYLPNGNPRPGPKWDYKLAWFGRLLRHARSLRAADVPVALCGDYNVVPAAADMYPSRSWSDNALVQPESRAMFADLLDQGWTDALRSLHPAGPLWTFWDYKRQAWPRDAGLRLDHILLTPDLARRLTCGGVDRDVRSRPEASDHAPAWVVLGSDTTPGRRRARAADAVPNDVARPPSGSRSGERAARGPAASQGRVSSCTLSVPPRAL